MPDSLTRIICFALLAFTGGCSHLETVVEPDPEFAVSYPLPPAQPIAYQGGAIFQAESAQELFRDARAYRVGDILTINLIEQTDAEVRSSTTTAKDDSVGLGITSLLGNPSPSLNGLPIGENYTDASRNFTGTGNSTQSNSLEGDLTVVVSQVLSNGNLIVRGEKIVSINQGTEYMRLSGLVRQQDIAPDNTVSSTKIANARVAYGGGGPLAQANSAGWLSRFFSSEYWPF
ncbi:MAG: flagellar basal body L-ring protein FlgH [Pseudomonadota bacterium]